MMENMICNRNDEIEQWLLPYINRPVYVKGYCWNRKFDGWTVIYEGEKSNLVVRNLLFDYRGKTYPVYGFLPSRYTMSTDLSYYNAFYEPEL